MLVLAVILALSSRTQKAPLRHPETGLISRFTPFPQGAVAFIFICFAIPGFIYGKMGRHQNDKDVINAMSHSMSTMGMYIVPRLLRRAVCRLL